MLKSDGANGGHRTKVKICGLSTPETVTAALENGADFIGFVFHAPSPRNIDPDIVRYLASYIPAHVGVCGLFVHPSDTTLRDILATVRIDLIQLHGSETPDRVSSVRRTFGLPVMKALGVAQASDLDRVHAYAAVSDWLLLDAKDDTSGFGGSGKCIDWSILNGFSPGVPWMLAGGLTASNVAQAIRLTAPPCVDVSSGVEITRGVKDARLISDFIASVRAADQIH